MSNSNAAESHSAQQSLLPLSPTTTVLAPDEPENFLLSELLAMPEQPTKWIFENLWQENTPAMITADDGVGKTHFVIQLGVAIVAGGDVPGTPLRCTEPRDFVFISQEDGAQLFKAELALQVPNLSERQDITNHFRIISTAIRGTTLSFQNAESRRYLSERIPRGAVVVFDSWSTFISNEENDNRFMQQEWEHLFRLTKPLGAHPFIIHHRPKAGPGGVQGDIRGATAIRQPVRFHMMLEAYRNQTVKLSFRKVSRGQKPEPIVLMFDPERRMFIPSELDAYVSLFKDGEKLTTSEVITRLGKDPKDRDTRKSVGGALKYRKGRINQVGKPSKKKEAVWQLRLTSRWA